MSSSIGIDDLSRERVDEDRRGINNNESGDIGIEIKGELLLTGSACQALSFKHRWQILYLEEAVRRL
jgi:hypothetical protein